MARRADTDVEEPTDIIDRVEFTDLVAGARSGPVTNIAGFAQLADDVRSVINYLHENEVVVDPVTGEGFFIDPVFTESCDAQMAMVATGSTLPTGRCRLRR